MDRIAWYRKLKGSFESGLTIESGHTPGGEEKYKVAWNKFLKDKDEFEELPKKKATVVPHAKKKWHIFLLQKGYSEVVMSYDKYHALIEVSEEEMGFCASCDWNDPRYYAGTNERHEWLYKNDPTPCGEDTAEDSESSDDEEGYDFS